MTDNFTCKSRKKQHAGLHGLFREGKLAKPFFVGMWQGCVDWRKTYPTEIASTLWIGVMQEENWIPCVAGRPEMRDPRLPDSKCPFNKGKTFPFNRQPAHHTTLENNATRTFEAALHDESCHIVTIEEETTTE